MLGTMNTNTNGLVGYGKELESKGYMGDEFKDYMGDDNLDIIL